MIRAQSRRGPSKTLEQERCARARRDVRKALGGLLTGLEPTARERVTDAIFDIASELHAHVHGPVVTATKHSATSGRLYPYAPAKTNLESAEAIFPKRRAAA